MSLNFIFTHDSFVPDMNTEALTQKDEKLREGFLSDRFAALFNIGFDAAGESESMSLGFLRTVSEQFLRSLTAMPELELVRESANVLLSEEASDELLEAVPLLT